jgi:tetratricopeptide (TPR) repeat protein
MSHGALIERDSERAWLQAVLAEALEGHGSVVLLAGEAGVGKTRFAEDVVESADVQLLRGASGPGALAYGPVTAALRGYMRAVPGGLSRCGPLRSHLALLLPELGEAIEESDRATLFEAIRCGLAAVAAERPAVVLLDDLQWSDDATLELLAALAAPLRELPMLVLGAYRSDEIPRAHPLRRLRNDLRRNHALRELTLEPLTAQGTAELAERVLGAGPSARLAGTLHDRTCGIPFFIEELAGALESAGRLQPGADGLELALDADVPLPQTVRDAVLLRAGDLSGRARTTAEAASVAGTRFDVELLAALGWEAGLDELLASGLIVELEPGRAAFRHPLARDAIYEDVPWLRRRSLHRDLAAALEARNGGQAEVAAHWLAARDGSRALDSLVRAVEELAAVHAYRDAARLGRQALDLWPEGERGTERIAVLERHARFSELSGELAEAARAQREVVAARRSEGPGRALPDAERSLAAIYELQGDRERALTARRVAADAFAANGLPGEAAAERLIAAGYLQSAGNHGDAVELTRRAGEEAARAERTDLRARALGLQGVTRVKGGEFDEGMEIIRAGLSLALEHGLTLEAAEVYQRLGTAHEIAGDYVGARDALATAVGFCEADGASTAASCWSAGPAARTTTTRSGACAGRRASSPAAARSARRAPAPRRCRASRPGRATRTHWPRSRTHSARRRSRRATRMPRPSSSAARPSCTRALTSRSSARRSNSAPASRSPRRGSAKRRSSGSARRTGRRAVSAPRRWHPGRPMRSRSSASRSSGGSGGARPPTTRTPVCRTASWR